MLLRLKTNNISILVSTPYMDEAELCDRVALIQDGTILSVDTPQEILANHRGRLLVLSSDDLYTLKRDLEGFDRTRSVYLFGRQLHLTVDDSVSDQVVAAYLEQKGHEGLSLESGLPNIEDCFLELMVKTQKRTG